MHVASRVSRLLVVACLATTALTSSVETITLPPLLRRPVELESGRLASDFIENQGQWSGLARFAARRGDVAAALEPQLIRLRLGTSNPQTVALVFEGASPRVVLTGEKKRTGVYNFIGGRDAASWRTNVPAYGSVIYRGMYDGVDVRVREQAQHFEYDLVVAPHADLRSVVVRVEGATSLELESDGALILHTAAGPLRQTPPSTSETLPDGATRPVASRFRIIGPQRYGFEAQDRDVQLPLVIDPGLVWSTLVGGTGHEQLSGFEAARDGSGDLFVSGNTTSADFATTPTPVQTARYKTFVARLDASGAHYDFVTFINGLQDQTYPAGLAADSSGGVTLVGTTVDLDFPVTAGAYQTAFASPIAGQSNGDGFVMRLNATGNVAFATYLGGSGHDDVRAAVFDARLNTLIVTGFTQSTNFPTTVGAYDRTFNTPPAGDTTAFASDAFVSRLSLDGSRLEYSTYFGGQTYEHPTDVIVDPQGFVTIAGVTTSSASGARIPLTADAFDSTWNGSEDGFLARFKLDGQGSADLKYSTFLGGVNQDVIEGIAFDPNNPELVVVAGYSWYDNFTGPFFPTTAGAFKRVLTPKPPATPLFPHSKTGFVTKFRFPAGAAGSLVWSTFAGGNWEDFLSDIAIDETGAVIVAGGTRSPDLQTTAGAADRTQDGVATGPHDCFVWKLGPDGNRLDYSTYIGGLYEDCGAVSTVGARVAYLGGNTIALAGMTASGDFETTPDAVLRTTDEVTDGSNPFVAKLTLAADTADSAVNAPALVSPANNSTTGGFGGVVRFRWTDVDDPSGIEGYVYEVSPKPDFPEGFVHYRGSVNSAELLLESIAINTPWFWRVRAADGAGNLSDWSPTSTFTAGVTGAASIVNFVQTFPSTVTGGSPAQGVLHLSDPAPAGGATAILSTKDPRGHLRTDSPITLPATVSIPAGQITANFTIPTVAVTAATPAAIYATVGAVGSKGSLSVGTAAAVTAASLMVDPLAVTGGNPATGTVTLTAAAPAGGTVVPILSSHPQYAAVPSSVTVPAGAISATFPITTSAVPFSFDATIEATGGQFATRKLALKTPGPRLTAFNLSASTVSGGSTLTGTVTFSGPIPTSPFPATGDALVTVKSTHPAVGFLPMVAVPVGQTSATFSIGVRNVPVTTTLDIIAAYDNTVLSRPVTVTGTAAALASLTLNVNTLTSGQGGAGFVNLTAPAPPGNVLVNLASNNPAITLPSTVTVSQGTTSGIFSYGSLPVQATTSATITASYGPSTASAGVTINPSAANVWVTSLALSPSTVAAGTSSTGTVTINAPAPSNGSTVQLSSVSPVVVPAGVTIPAGATSVTFNVGTTSVSSTTQVKVYAVLNTTWGAVLTVTAGAASTPALASLSLSPTSVTGGNSSQGTVTLSSAAPSGGAVVTLSSSNTAAATVPSSVTVAAGATSRTFSVTTQTVSSSTSATISGTLGVSRSATLTVNASTTPSAPSLIAPANGATVAVPVTFDWSDVANAASYQIQVDDSSSFPTPRVIDVTVTASQYTHTSPALAIRQHWWRVRGRNAAGTAGSWSSVRSFTPEGTPTAPALSALSMNPTSVTGGTSAQGTATLTAAAPSGGAVVTLSSGNTAAVTVPASVTVPSGSTSAIFAVSSLTVTAPTTVTITGAYGGTTRTATVTVNPVAPTGTAMLTVSATGRSGERITSTPAGISVLVGSTGSASFTAGTSITLTVSNGRDAVWSGACSSGGNKTRTCTFTLNASATVSANVQ